MVTIYLAREGSAYILEDAGHSLELHSPLRIRLLLGLLTILDYLLLFQRVLSWNE